MSNKIFKTFLYVFLLINFTHRVYGQQQIVGGIITSEDQYPFMVSLMRWGHHKCGGTLISFSWILTASHCLFTADGTHIQSDELTVVAGITKLNQLSAKAQKRSVQNYYTHDNYNGPTTSDIALVKVAEQFTPSDAVYSISLPVELAKKSNMYNALKNLITTTCEILGWGASTAKQPGEDLHLNIRDLSNNLRMGKINIIPPKKCQSLYGNVKIRPHHICAMAKGVDACGGDSGGPLICNGTQYGIISFGSGCAQERPGVYVRTDFYTEWIESIIYRTEPASIYYNRKYSEAASSFTNRMVDFSFTNHCAYVTPKRNLIFIIFFILLYVF